MDCKKERNSLFRFPHSKFLAFPVVASGGAGTLEHFYEGVVKGGAKIQLAASVFHFRTFRVREVKEFLRNKVLGANLWP